MIKRCLYFGNPAYLSLANNQIVIRLGSESDDSTSREVVMHLEDIGLIMLDHSKITLTKGLMSALLDYFIAVVVCDKARLPHGIMLPLKGNSLFNKVARRQLSSTQPLKKNLWQQTVRCKIRNQAALLRMERKVSTERMNRMADEVKSGDTDNYEGQAAAYYWRHIFPDIPGFVRMRGGKAPNNLLNYGYAVLRAIVARALVISGMLPLIGIHHHNERDSFCLADDIMEPYRPFVDKLVIDLMKELSVGEELSKELKGRLISLPDIDVLLNGEIIKLGEAVARSTASLAACFRGERKKILYPAFVLDY